MIRTLSLQHLCVCVCVCVQILDTSKLSIGGVKDQATGQELEFRHFVQAEAKPFGAKLEIDLPPGGERR